MPNDNIPYKIIEKIGSGGGGIVYKAWHERLQKHVVLKEIKSSVIKLEQNRAEVDILKNLKHSYLPQVYDFYEDDGRVFTVMEYIEGESFDKLLENGKCYTQKEVIKWGTQLSEAVAYLHERKPPILHSDIKPANVMLTKEGDICLIDFNISLLLDDDGAVVIGLSYGYASPEQYASRDDAYLSQTAPKKEITNDITEVLPDNKTEILNKTQTLIEDDKTEILTDEPMITPLSVTKKKVKKLDVRSDIYSLGATLYHILTGERPAMKATEVKDIEIFGEFGESLVYIITKAMKPDMEQRFQTSSQMLKAFKNINKLDKRWKKYILSQNIAAFILTALFCLSAISAAYGYKLMGGEKEELYRVLSNNITTATIDETEILFEEASSLFPNRITAYHAKATQLAKAGEYELCREFINQSLQIIEIQPEDNHKLADMYFIMANSYFEEEDYLNAIQYYSQATKLFENNPDFYRDYAILLARTGNIEEADRLANFAETLGLKTDSLDLLRGEIAYNKGELEKAVSYMLNVINITSDDYILYRAYKICDDAYKKQGKFEEEINLLETAISELPINRSNEFTERLASAYENLARITDDPNKRREYYLKSAELFNQLKNSGYATFIVRQNIGIIYQNLDMFYIAQKEFEELIADFPNDYRPFMNLANLIADKQQNIPNEERDYSLFITTYETALKIYNENKKQGEDDPEMLMLTNLYEQLKSGNWID